MRADSSGPMPAIGSSSSSSCGRVASARPTSSARCSPCESCGDAAAWPASARPTSASTARASSNSARSRRTGRQNGKLEPLRACTASARLSSTLSAAEDAGDLVAAREAAPRRAACCGRRGDVVAVEDDLAAVGRKLPPICAISVVLPAPFGPISACTSPRAHLEVDAVGGDQAAEALVAGRDVEQEARRPARRRLSGAGGHPRRAARSSPTRPWRANSTTRAAAAQPVQNCQCSV